MTAISLPRSRDQDADGPQDENQAKDGVQGQQYPSVEHSPGYALEQPRQIRARVGSGMVGRDLDEQIDSGAE